VVVSVVIPAYNRTDLLERAMASVRRQSTDSWEAIVVDDASSEDLKTIVEQQHDRRFRYVRRATNGGVAAAQNTGIDHATGRYVAFLHSDDELLPDSLERRGRILDDAPAAIGVVECGHEELDDFSRPTLHAPYLVGASADDLLAYRAGVHISKILVRRALAEAARFDESLRGAEDRDFMIRLLRRTGVAITPEPLVRIERTVIGLRGQPKGPIYEYLYYKYRDEITAAPALERSWWFRIARAYIAANDVRPARAAIWRAIRAEPTRARLWPLGGASFLGDRVFTLAMRAYQRIVHRVVD
jgi:glycosyltransferase involved in cell wall biosynthesis